MYTRKKKRNCWVWHGLRFQAFTGGLNMNPIWIKRLYCAYINPKQADLENGAFGSSSCRTLGSLPHLRKKAAIG